MRLNPEYIRELLGLVNTSPFPQHMAMRLESIDVDRAEVSLAVSACHFQPFQIVHGGVLATLIDTATFWAVFMRLPEDAGLVNIDLKLNYLKPVDKGPLITKGRCIKAGRTISYAEASVYSDRGEIFAHGTSSLMVLPGKGVRLATDKFLNE